MSDFDRTFNIWTDVGLFCFIVFVLVSVIKLNGLTSKSKTFVTDKGQHITLVSDGDVDFTDANTTLISYDFITGETIVKLSSGEEKVYNLKASDDVLGASNVLNIAGMTDRYSIIPGTDENITRCFVDYAMNNNLYGHSLSVIDYNNDTRELVYTDNGSDTHKLKLGISGFYNDDRPEVRVHNSDSDILPLFTGFLIGRYLK